MSHGGDNDQRTNSKSSTTPPAPGTRPPGRPRSREADEAILSAALDLLIERGAGAAGIEQVARRAGVTRATVYRRFPTLTDLLVRAIEWEYRDLDPGSLDWPDVDAMITDWAGHLSSPRSRRLARRLYATVDDLPELLRAYHDAHGHHRGRAVRAALERARAAGRLPPGSDPEVLQQMLSGAALQHLAAHPDTTSAEEVRAYFTAVLRQAGYRPSAIPVPVVPVTPVVPVPRRSTGR
ncbi:TetR/AcrR family transcriptional regulator [Streptomyces roseoverticillatus]|uniref:TetR/AcrR family transcriptional regulator n=1 Tax=Streptomyces roseoverticillatus TaxID=66429 RepID=UPI001F391631|nr:TetR/AcrR family transcriptional regulator [Streptomyces roseoverticillatus]MCF3106555.1 TetR/AcrR family transcriptional regulator [Streptomyces roseoverticillatus]